MRVSGKSDGGSRNSYGEDGHPVSPIAMGGTDMSIGDSGGVGEEDESEESEKGTDGLDDSFDMPFGIMLLQSMTKVGGEEWPHRKGMYRRWAEIVLDDARRWEKTRRGGRRERERK